MKKSISGIAAAAVLILLLTHPALTLSGARQGLLLWSQTVLPTLLPFMICSNVVVAAGGLPFLMAPFRPFLRYIMNLSDQGGYVLISGLLCGYPMGAKTCAEFLEQGLISLPEARYLLAVSNHPSPMFLLGYAASHLGPQIPIWKVLAALYLPVIPLSLAARSIYRPPAPRPDRSAPQTFRAASPHPPKSAPPADFDAIMMRSIEIMVRIGGYIMAFSILADLIGEIRSISPAVRSVLLGFAEITTGIHAISLSVNGNARGLLITAATAFGGLSGVFQTKSVLNTAAFSDRKKAGLSIRHYIFWKMAHTALSCLLYTLL